MYICKSTGDVDLEGGVLSSSPAVPWHIWCGILFCFQFHDENGVTQLSVVYLSETMISLVNFAICNHPRTISITSMEVCLYIHFLLFLVPVAGIKHGVI